MASTEFAFRSLENCTRAETRLAYNAARMGDPVQCAECEAILRELSAADRAAMEAEARGARELLGTLQSADDDGLQELLSKNAYRLSAEGTVAVPSYSLPQFRRLWIHRARTGHWPFASNR